MKTYTSQGHTPITAKNKTVAAMKFADEKAATLGDLGEVSTCYALKFGGDEYKAFIGMYSPKEDAVRGRWYYFDVCAI